MDDDDADQLRERVEKLEQIVASQQETIEQLREKSLLGQWGRRGVLGSIAAVFGLASASGSAAAGLGDVGTASGRVDVFADQADVLSLEANKTDTDIIQTRSKSVTTSNNTIDFNNFQASFIELSAESDPDTLSEVENPQYNRLVIIAQDSITLKSSSGNEGQLLLDNSTDFDMQAGDVIELISDSFSWYEIGRTDR